MFAENLIRQLLSGFSLGMVVFIIAVGLSLIFGTLKVLNMAHGSIYMLGAFLCYWLTSSLGDVPGIFWWSLLVAPLGAALFGGIIEILLLRRIYGLDMMYQWILTFGLILFIGDLCRLLWGVDYYMVAPPWPLDGPVEVLGVYFPAYNLFVMALGPVILIGIVILLRFTRLGRVIRAATFNPEMVGALGVNVPLTFTLVFMFGCWLAGLGGALVAPMTAVSLGMDAAVIIDCFIIVVIGGLGSTLGAFIGAVIFGLSYALGILVAPKLAIGIGFFIMAVILIIRPWGLLGKPE
ncbi:MAG: branched-chain amino acid ABC transporter permease [Deltaproteobacteria bacterium]|nr:branched-chain amino acid ABC transporter permease [Deltaproteobacteria bacterium]